MKYKDLVVKLKDNAELAWASYFNFHLIGWQFEEGQLKDIVVTHIDAANMKYKEYKVFKKEEKQEQEEGQKKIKKIIDNLNGEFSPLQAKAFFEKYDLLIHQPNTKSGFSATLFGEKRKQIDKKTKKISYTNEYGYVDYNLAIRGTEKTFRDIVADFHIAGFRVPNEQYKDMIIFYYQCLGELPIKIEEIEPQKGTLEYEIYKRIQGNTANLYVNPILFQQRYSFLLKSAHSFIDKHSNALAKKLSPAYANQIAQLNLKAKSFLQDNRFVKKLDGELKSQNDDNKKNLFVQALTKDTPLTLTGHSLGGTLAQLFILSFADYRQQDRANLKALYTYNAPGAVQLKPPFEYILYLNERSYNDEELERIARECHTFFNALYYESKESFILGQKSFYDQLKIELKRCKKNNFIGYIGIKNQISAQYETVQVNELVFQKLSKEIAMAYEKLIVNFNHHKQNEYYTDIGIEIHHCESSNDAKHNTSYLGSLISKLNIKLGLSKDDEYENTTILHTINTVAGYTGSHYIIFLTYSLCFYEYLLQLKSNHSELMKNLQQDDFCSYLNKLNVYLINIKIYAQIFRANTNENDYESDIDKKDEKHLILLFARIHQTVDKIERLNKYKNAHFMDIMLKLKFLGYFIKMLDEKQLIQIKNECKISSKKNISEKVVLNSCEPFMLVDENDEGIINAQNLHTVLGYKGLGAICSENWHEEYINGKYKIMKGVYFQGKTKSPFTVYAKAFEKEKEKFA